MNVTRRPISNGNMALSSKETARRNLIRPWAQQPVAESNSAIRSYPPTASTGKCENCESEMLRVDRLLAESRSQPINDERRVQQQERAGAVTGKVLMAACIGFAQHQRLGLRQYIG